MPNAVDILHTPESGQIFGLSFVSQQSAPAIVRQSPDGTLNISVPPRILRLTAMEELAWQTANIVAHCSGKTPSIFAQSCGLQVDSNKICKAVCTIESNIALDCNIALSAALNFVQALKGRGSPSQLGLNVDASPTVLPTEMLATINEIANSILGRVGGSVINYPCDIISSGKRMAEFSGVFSSKPEVLQQPEELTVIARIDGFWRRKRVLFLELESGETLRANWQSDEDCNEVIRLATDVCHVRELKLLRSVDASGKEVLTIVF
jgi:hypothetical protein